MSGESIRCDDGLCEACTYHQDVVFHIFHDIQTQEEKARRSGSRWCAPKLILASELERYSIDTQASSMEMDIRSMLVGQLLFRNLR